jgi:tetratricopeptide (TPR) repeat protein
VKKYFLLLILIATTITAQNARLDSLIHAGIYQIYGIEFPQAEKTFQIVQKDYPKNPAGKFFDAMIDWWRIMLDMDNEEYDDAMIDKLEDVIDMCDDILDENENDVNALFFKGGALGFRGRLYSVREEWLDAALDGKDAMPIVNHAYAIDPNNPDVQLGFGIYNYYAAVIPEKFPFLKPFMLFFPEGNKEKGLEELKFVAENGKFGKIEARYFLLSSYYKFEENMFEAKKWADRLLKDFPNNPTFEKYLGRIYVKMGSYIKASPVFEDIFKKCESGLPGYNDVTKREAAYYVGMRYKLQNNVDSTRIYFEISEKLSKKIDDEETGWLVNSLLYLGMCYDQLGDRDKAVKYYNEVLDMDDRRNSHEQARRYLKNPYKH